MNQPTGPGSNRRVDKGIFLVPTQPALDTLSLISERFVIGKGEDVIAKYAQSHPLEVNCLSRLHAVVDIDDGRITVTDRGSTNGTLVNGIMLEKDQAVMLNHGDTLIFGHELFSYQLHVDEISSRADTDTTVPSDTVFSSATSGQSDFTVADSSVIHTMSRPGQAGVDTRMFSSNIGALGKLLESDHSPQPIHGDSLMGAATAVGAADSISIVQPGASERAQLIKDPIESIARASRVRFRYVILADDWWTSDCGPMLGYLEKGHHPVALIPTSSGSYDIVDPATGSQTAINYKSSVALELRAVRFYRRLPDSLTSVWQMPRWALKGNSTDLVSVFLLSLVVTVIGMLVPQAMALIIDTAIPNANRRMVAEIGSALVLAALGTALFGLAQGVLSVRLGMISDTTSQAAVWDRLLALRMGVFRLFGSGDLLDRAMGVSAISKELNGQTLQSLLTSVTALLNLGLLFWYSARLATVVLVIGLLIALFTVVAGVSVRKYYRELMELQGRFFGFVVELISATGKIRVAGAQRRAFGQWSNRYSDQLALTLKAQQVEDYIIVFNYIIPLTSSVLMYWMAANLLTSGNADTALTVGTFLAFNMAMGTFLGGVTFLSVTILDIMDNLAMADRTKPLLMAESEISNNKVDPGVLKGKIALSDVHFRYLPNSPKILKGIDLEINPEKFVALVGTSGSGKSTIFRLLLGFEEPESGRVLFDDQDLATLDITAVRRQLGVVLQNARINSASIFDNISTGAPITMEQAWDAAEDAGFADDIRTIPMGMQTVISEGGVNLSGGQRQRLMIARALVRNPKILLFDEATSALDNKTQSIVSASLRRRRVTRVVIAHRLSTIRDADHIVVLDGGKIVESGDYATLSKSGGLFTSMMKHQSIDNV